MEASTAPAALGECDADQYRGQAVSERPGGLGSEDVPTVSGQRRPLVVFYRPGAKV